MNDENCIFCKIVKGELPSFKLYEDDSVVSFLTIAPINEGHALVVPKSHYQDFFDTPESELQKIISVGQKVSSAIKKAVNCTGINIVQNNGKSAGQEIMHYHLHIIPRFEEDGFEQWHGKQKAPEEIKIVAEKIKSTL